MNRSSRFPTFSWRPAVSGRPIESDLLYLHPSGHLNDLVVPAGALTCLNRAAGPRLGRYAFEVTDEEVRAATIIAIDLHWSVAIAGFERLAARVRQLNPRAAIVAGGITAGFYAGELLGSSSADFVILGHAETPFAELVAALRTGGSPEKIAGVASPDRPAPALHQATTAELDAIDSLTADWFPTYDERSNWDAAAFPPGRLIAISRGCPMQCPECYGSYASTFGGDHLVRTPAAVTRDTARAAEMGLRNLRYFAARPTARQLSELIVALADTGPHHFTSGIGFYVCRPPSPTDLDALEAAFACPVAISAIAPSEQLPRLSPARIAEDTAAWQRAAARIQRSRRLELDMWVTDRGALAPLRAAIGATTTRGGRLKASSAAAWSVIRPTDAQPVELEELRGITEPLWTFYAGRALSPSLARLLLPFAFVDELDSELDPLPLPDPDLARYHQAVSDNWRRWALPTIPGLSFALVPVTSAPSLVDRLAGIEATGNVALLAPATAAMAAPDHAIPLVTESDHRGALLVANLPAGCETLAFVPHLPPDRLTGESLDRLATAGLVALRLPPAIVAAGGACRARIYLQGVSVALIDSSGEIIAEGCADLGYFPTPPGSGNNTPVRNKPPRQPR